jgi:hypothetical protein
VPTDVGLRIFDIGVLRKLRRDRRGFREAHGPWSAISARYRHDSLVRERNARDGSRRRETLDPRRRCRLRLQRPSRAA